MNITDVEDKIIKRVRETGTAPARVHRQVRSRFLRGPQDPELPACRTQTPRATEHIPEIIALIEKLIARGLAYQTPDGSVYFSIEKYRGRGCTYGQLVKLNFDEMRAGERVRSDEYDKEAVADFALWKARVPEDGAVFWPSPWGEGRPGWHIECSAMSMKLLGPSFDLHLGGEDLIFPHHEDEIAQSEGAGVQTAGPALREILAARRPPAGRRQEDEQVARQLLHPARSAGQRIHRARNPLPAPHRALPRDVQLHPGRPARRPAPRWPASTSAWPSCANWPAPTPPAAATRPLSEQLRRRPGRRPEHLRRLGRRLRLGPRHEPAPGGERARPRRSRRRAGRLGEGGFACWASARRPRWKCPPEIPALLEARQAARKAKDFKRADAIRDELKAKGWVIEDTPKGPRQTV